MGKAKLFFLQLAAILWNLVRAVGNAGSQLLYFLLTGDGRGNESLSGASAVREHKHWKWRVCRVTIDTLCFWEKNHCAKSAWNDYDWCAEYMKDPYFRGDRP